MEQIIKVTADTESELDHDYKESHFFHSIEQAKRWCEKNADQVIDWQTAKHVNPFCFWSNEITIDSEHCVHYYMEPITITVLDEDDGEV